MIMKAINGDTINSLIFNLIIFHTMLLAQKKEKHALISPVACLENPLEI